MRSLWSGGILSESVARLRHRIGTAITIKAHTNWRAHQWGFEATTSSAATTCATASTIAAIERRLCMILRGASPLLWWRGTLLVNWLWIMSLRREMLWLLLYWLSISLWGVVWMIILGRQRACNLLLLASAPLLRWLITIRVWSLRTNVRSTRLSICTNWRSWLSTKCAMKRVCALGKSASALNGTAATLCLSVWHLLIVRIRWGGAGLRLRWRWRRRRVVVRICRHREGSQLVAPGSKSDSPACGYFGQGSSSVTVNLDCAK